MGDEEEGGGGADEARSCCRMAGMVAVAGIAFFSFIMVRDVWGGVLRLLCEISGPDYSCMKGVLGSSRWRAAVPYWKIAGLLLLSSLPRFQIHHSFELCGVLCASAPLSSAT